MSSPAAGRGPRNRWAAASAVEIETAALAQFPGEKNKALSTRQELRIGSKGAISVRLTGAKAGAWFDHENDGGGYLKGEGDGREEKKPQTRSKRLKRPRPRASDPARPTAADTDKGAIQLFHSSDANVNGNGHDPEAGGDAAGDARTEAEAAAAFAELEQVNHLRGHFAEAAPLSGTPGEGYLGKRRKLGGPFPPSLHYAARFRPTPDAPPGPALLAAVTDDAGEIVALHSVRIDPAAGDKAAVDKPKLSHGPVSQGTIFLGSAAAPATTLVVAEGIETALSRRVVGPADIHACAGGLRFVEPGKRHRRVEIVADTDKRPKARQLARRYATEHRLAAFVVTVPDTLGPRADLNDALQDLGVGAVQSAMEDAERIEASGSDGVASPYDLARGSDVEIAEATSRILEDLHGPLVVADGAIWRYDRTHWWPVDDRQVARLIHKADGCVVYTPRGTPSFVALSKGRVLSIVDAMMTRAADPDFFRDGPVGINCEGGFIAFDEHGEPGLMPHARRHRQRHVVRGRWPCAAGDEQRAGSLLARYLRQAFEGDEDADDRRNLVAEVLGCAALGYGTRMKQPKAIVAYSTRGNTGKSTFLKLARKLLDGAAICEVPIGKLGDDRFAVQLVGKALNTSDELNDRAVRSDSFKKAVTGDLMSARDVYKPVVTFRPVALHLFSTNALPGFKGGVDGGVARRLLPVEFAHVVPEADVIPDLDERIAREEADLLLEFAVEGASRVLTAGLFTVPKSSAEIAREWLADVDPVRGWAAERLEVTKEARRKIAAAALLDDFNLWAERQGFNRDHLPNPNAFGRRLMAAAPELKKKHSNGIVYLNARLRTRRAEAMP